MAKRVSKIVSVIRRRSGQTEWSELDRMIGHPCGSIAWVMRLSRNPDESIVVSRYLAQDAFSMNDGEEWNRWSFASMLSDMHDFGCILCKDARDLVKWWKRAGRPQPWLA